MAKPAIEAAPAGEGSPLKFMWSSSSPDSTLNRARRNAAQAANAAAISQILSCEYVKDGHIFTNKNPGATPNETTSHKLSSCAPKSELLRESRATWPSSASKIMAKKMSQPLSMKLCVSLVGSSCFMTRVGFLKTISTAWGGSNEVGRSTRAATTIAKKPQIRLASVNTVGKTATVRILFMRVSCQTPPMAACSWLGSYCRLSLSRRRALGFRVTDRLDRSAPYASRV